MAARIPRVLVSIAAAIVWVAGALLVIWSRSAPGAFLYGADPLQVGEIIVIAVGTWPVVTGLVAIPVAHR